MLKITVQDRHPQKKLGKHWKEARGDGLIGVRLLQTCDGDRGKKNCRRRFNIDGERIFQAAHIPSDPFQNSAPRAVNKPPMPRRY
jgi:hypothetical protein